MLDIGKGFLRKNMLIYNCVLYIILLWQHFGNRKSLSQNKLCNCSKKSAFLQPKLNKIV